VRDQLALGFRQPKERLATRRKRAKIYGAIAALFVTGSLVWGASALSYHERFVIQDINVVGAQALSASAVESSFGLHVNDGVRHFFSRANVFLYPYSELQQTLLQEFPLMKAVSFSRDSLLSQAITIVIAEREPKYLWCTDTCYFMDAQGFIFAPAENPQGFMQFRGGLTPNKSPIGQTFLKGSLERLLIVIESVKGTGFTPVETTIDSERDISISVSEGFIIKTTLDAVPEALSKNLALVTSSGALSGKLNDVLYVDLRFGNRVYYKFENEE
jgi:cell division septal protein FtsQ